MTPPLASASTPDIPGVEKAIDTTIRAWSQRLIEISHEIHRNPELAFEEHHAAALVAETLREAGFAAEVGVYGLDTAVEAVYGNSEFVVTLCAEYDALPEIGHACGHNLIAAAAVGAAVALAAVADEAGITVKVLGTPAEERGGGKVLMLAAGAWEDCTISMMVHGGPHADIRCEQIGMQAVDRFEVTYAGRPAHAAGAPQRGVNALDAATIALTSIGLLSQQLPDTVRVAAIVAEGGAVTNIIPERSVVRAEVRSFDLEELRDVKSRVLACFRAGATASGCTWQHSYLEPRYESMRQDPALSTAWNAAVEALGRTPVDKSGSGISGGSTDMGNVSQVVPAIHPVMAALGVTALPHTAEFAAEAVSPAADRMVIDGATALARTAVTAAMTPTTRTDLIARQRARRAGATRVSPTPEEGA
ncbi:amidohydrolase [Nocardia carnea]|uniref:amidohydrolase n=1 Tax=Nocardia carnea TaxID=37328 RepID=UPI002456E9AF|nr:amidohydrolase [Nocardia carnea]